jgi:hypothetical protein
MIFELNQDIDEHKLKSSEKAYGEEFTKNGEKYYRVKFLKNNLHKDLVMTLEQDKLAIVDRSIIGVETLHSVN